jgi:hypothetical protein
MIYTILFNDADPSFSQQRREGHDLCSVFTIIMYVGHTKSHSTVMKIEISVEKGVYSKRPYQFLNCSQLGSQLGHGKKSGNQVEECVEIRVETELRAA